jgi:hypothetical protein
MGLRQVWLYVFLVLFFLVVGCLFVTGVNPLREDDVTKLFGLTYLLLAIFLGALAHAERAHETRIAELERKLSERQPPAEPGHPG